MPDGAERFVLQGHRCNSTPVFISWEVWDLALNQVGTRQRLFPPLVCAKMFRWNERRDLPARTGKSCSVSLSCKQSPGTYMALTWRVTRRSHGSVLLVSTGLQLPV